MKIQLSIVFMVIAGHCFGQFAIVDDPDGSANVRQKPDISSKIEDTLHNGHFVYCMETQGNWFNVDFDKKQRGINGYVYGDRLKLISTYEPIPLTHSETEMGIVLAKDSISISFSSQKVAKGKYRYSYFKENPAQIELVDGKQYFGRDGDAPTKEYRSIIIHLGSRMIELPRIALANLFEPTLFHSKANYDRQHDILYISSENSDGAGTYEVVWRVEKGVYTDRYIEFGF
jgi:Bacterial SH3 domain